MRRDLVIITVLLIAAVGGLVWAHGEIGQAKNDIVIKETVLYGDASLTDGMELTMNSKMDEYLYWSTVFWPGTGRKAESTFEFRDDSSVNMDKVISPYDVNFTMYARSDTRMSEYPGEVAFDKDEGYAASYYDTNMIRPVYELVQETGIADTKTKVFALSGYYDYYPIIGDFSTGSYMQQDMYAVDRLSEVFRIPVAEDHLVEVTVVKDDEGKISFSMKPVNGEAAVYGMKYSYGMAEDGFYVLVHNQGIDCSEFLDGYGIYKIPLVRGELTVRMYLEDMHNCYPIDRNSVNVVGMSIDETGERILLFTREEEKLYLTTIRIDGMVEEGTISLSDIADESEIKDTFYGTDYVVMELIDGRLALITLEEEWEIQWIVSPEEPLDLHRDYAVMDSKDGQLAIVTASRPETWDRMAYVTIIDGEGVQFKAEYTVVGDRLNNRSYNHGMDYVYLGSRTDGITLQNKSPFTISW